MTKSGIIFFLTKRGMISAALPKRPILIGSLFFLANKAHFIASSISSVDLSKYLFSILLFILFLSISIHIATPLAIVTARG